MRVWYLLSAWDSQEWLQRWAAAEAGAEEPVVAEEEELVVAVEELVVEVEQPVVEARGSAAQEFPGTRLRPLSMPHHARRSTDKGRPILTAPN